MDVRPVGAGLTGAELSQLLRPAMGAQVPVRAAGDGVVPSGDTVAALLGQLSQPDVVRILDIIACPLPPESVARLGVLLGAAVSAAAAKRVEQALGHLTELAALDPQRGETLEAEPGLASIRPEVSQLLSRLASAARLNAEARLGQATELSQAAGARPEAALLIAGRLLEAGGYANSARSAELSQALIDGYVARPLPTESAARLAALLNAAVSAAAENQVQKALGHLTELAALDPRRAETLAAEPGLASIRSEVSQLLSRLASAARQDAEARFGQAARLPQGLRLEAVLLMAGRLLEAGGYANWVRSAELSRALINEYGARSLPPEIVARLGVLLGSAVSAAAEKQVQQALGYLAEFAALDPRRAETLAAEPGLASIRSEVSQLLSRLASAARVDAEARLGQATQLLQAAGSGPEVMLLIAGRLLEAGGYANWVRSAELSQVLINEYGFAPVPVPLPLAEAREVPSDSRRARPRLRRRWLPWLRERWRRSPRLVLLLGWLAAGMVGGSVSLLWRTYWPESWPAALAALAFDIWGLGFLAVIVAWFYVSARASRRQGRRQS
jgi:DNA-directed RNA polymerase subunit F